MVSELKEFLTKIRYVSKKLVRNCLKLMGRHTAFLFQIVPIDSLTHVAIL